MRNFTLTLCVLAVVMLFATGLKAQDGTTYTDDFSVARDYLTEGVTGTIWDAVVVNDTLWGNGVAAEITSLNTNDLPGALSFSAINSSLAWGADNGAFIYKTVAGGADFEAQVKIVGGDFISFGAEQVFYFMPGLIAKVANDTTFVLLQAFDVLEWGAVYGVRDIIPAEGLQQENWVSQTEEATDLKVAEYPYMKLEKYESTFTGYYSNDGMVWHEIYSVDKPEFAGKDIQVGLYCASYTDAEGLVQFDDYSMVDYNENSSAAQFEATEPSAFYSNHEITVNTSSKSNISSVKLYSIDGALRYSNNNVNARSLSFPVNNSGMYILVSETAGKVYTQKISAY